MKLLTDVQNQDTAAVDADVQQLQADLTAAITDVSTQIQACAPVAVDPAANAGVPAVGAIPGVGALPSLPGGGALPALPGGLNGPDFNLPSLFSSGGLPALP